MQSTATVTENNDPIEILEQKGQILKKPSSTNYLILVAIAVFCCILLFLRFPLWIVFIFGLGMGTVVLVLHLIRGINIDFELEGREVDNALEQDLLH